MQVKLRGESMQAAADAAESSMVSVIGLDSGKVQEICDAVNERVGAGSVQIANFLCPGNYVISGSSEVRSTQHTLPCQACGRHQLGKGDSSDWRTPLALGTGEVARGVATGAVPDV